ncbi:MAG: glycosyltransferase family 4 protein [Patescibacteria group bacterium]
MKKRVLIFSLFYYPSFVSGAEEAVREITDRIDPDEIEFHVVTLAYDSTLSRTERIGNTFVHRIGRAKAHPTFQDLGKWPLNINKPLFQFMAAWKASRLQSQYHFDATWAIMAHATGVPAALFKLFHPRVPFVLTLQEGDPTDRIERVMKPLWPLFLRAFTSANVIQAISTFLADWAKKRGARCPIHVIHNGASPNDIHQTVSQKDIDDVQALIGKQPGDIFLVNTARLVVQKGWDTTIRALPMLPANIKLLVVGDGPDEASLKQLVGELHLNDRVVFVGHIDPLGVTAYRKAADIFVGPSRSEGLGNAFLSAMASELPVVATRAGGLADYIFDAKRNPNKPTTAWAVDPDAPEQIAEAVRSIINHPEDVKQITARARAMILASYDWDGIAKQMQKEIFEPLWQIE